MPQPPLSELQCQEALDAVATHGTITAAAAALGMNRATFQTRINEARRRMGIVVVSQTTLTNLQTGEGVLQWEKIAFDKQREAEAQQAAYSALAAELPRVAPIHAPTACIEALCNLYSYFDFHVGMLAWRKEGGDDWDLTIAERTLQQSYAAMVTQSPAARKAIICIGGDWLHTDGLLPLTPVSKHVLDADGRFSKIVQVAIRGIRFIVTCALSKHSEVELVVMEGNHDETGSIWLRHMLTALYENEPRLSVNASELPFYVTKWGDVMLGFHHGHKVKNEQLPLLFAAQFPKIWGETTSRAIHCGHRHHVDEKEYNGVTVVQHPTLAARDAYAARGGWIAERAIQAITYHKKYGQVGRVYVSPEMLRAA